MILFLGKGFLPEPQRLTSTVLMLLLIQSFTVILVTAFTGTVDGGQGEPPQIYEGIKTGFRVPLGTKLFKLSCPVTTDVNTDGVIVRWMKDDEEIGSEWNSPYKLANSNRELKIKNPHVVDSGRYKCRAVNGFGYREVEFVLEVYDPIIDARRNPQESIILADRPMAPTWYDADAINAAIESPLHLNEGERLDLRCPAQGNPLPEIVWTKNGQRIDLGELSSKNGKTSASATFQLDNVQQSDSGVYACKLENRHGTLQAKFKVSVGGGSYAEAELGDVLPNVLVGQGEAPMIDQPYNSSVRLGHTAQFLCKVQWSKQQPMIRWLKEVDNPKMVKASNPNATILHISHIHLLVLEQPLNSTFIQAGDNNQAKAYINRLILNDVKPSDGGRYFCVVTNNAGQFVYRSALLQVVSGSDFAPLSATPNVFFAVIIIIVLVIVAFAVIWLCCNSSSSSDNGSKGSCSSDFCTSSNICTNSVVNKKSIGIHQPPPPSIPLPKAPAFIPNTMDGQQTTLARIIKHQQQYPHSPLIYDGRPMPPQRFPNPRQCMSSTLDRRYRPTPHQGLHRTQHEDEMSALSSNIYDSGSPLPPPPSHCGTSTPHAAHRQFWNNNNLLPPGSTTIYMPDGSSTTPTMTTQHRPSMADSGDESQFESNDHFVKNQVNPMYQEYFPREQQQPFIGSSQSDLDQWYI